MQIDKTGYRGRRQIARGVRYEIPRATRASSRLRAFSRPTATASYYELALLPALHYTHFFDRDSCGDGKRRRALRRRVHRRKRSVDTVQRAVQARQARFR
ncbi:hypothetical protein FIBSPDRAFT_871557 [Athelia psychrophila]|uniref:Uncharacterized protein n=1 Tax=Athelia psychrophila TaxID=1759441 RepID=A0A166A920_9AGAM|nr:hypothetical protein FIBSPDRAFT_871557 [Fibularhizoctonia sp. CBS 109695]